MNVVGEEGEDLRPTVAQAVIGLLLSTTLAGALALPGQVVIAEDPPPGRLALPAPAEDVVVHAAPVPRPAVHRPLPRTARAPIAAQVPAAAPVRHEVSRPQAPRSPTKPAPEPPPAHAAPPPPVTVASDSEKEKHKREKAKKREKNSRDHGDDEDEDEDGEHGEDEDEDEDGEHSHDHKHKPKHEPKHEHEDDDD